MLTLQPLRKPVPGLPRYSILIAYHRMMTSALHTAPTMVVNYQVCPFKNRILHLLSHHIRQRV